MKKLSNKKLAMLVSILCFAVVIFSTTIGIADISFIQTIKILLNRILLMDMDMEGIKSSASAIIWLIRFPRALLAFFVGGSLAICGVSYQSIFKNPMADPYILGVSSGAALGATVGIVARLEFYIFGLNAISILAFIGATGSLFLVYNISRVGKKVPVNTLLLSGIAIGQFLSAAISLMMVFANDLHRIIFWTMGSFNARSWSQLIMVLPYALIGFAVIFSTQREMDIMLLGEDTAAQLGVDTERLKRKILVTTALVTAASVSVTGIIGFVGLIIPHIVRIFTGPKHIYLIPYSFVAGGIFMILCDTLARSMISQEIPVGIITALFGGPFFVYLLKQRKTGGL
ncbi:FecCD family ABC transporter permease [Alkalibacter saccharofermentans]|uniref:Iron complex transport system permease protein n=1 Tax=Alkalibacter saccharofermentans DSM 14828 TaxID=1120975 RepID=A0A1M4XE19_9FIRM|nr:iron chelate uptake ABC transporter family permease subunit [Alkalibacter saccharofermentans]SHE91693.1 iron complex transport system permease protein [Alkalibacter saccharofermentans DSM 14828]